MKYNINLNQKALVELSPEITLPEAVILDYIYFICNSLNKKVQDQRIDGYTWIDYNTLIEDLPILQIKTTQTLKDKITNLEKFEYITTKLIKNQKGTFKFIKLSSKIDLLFKSYGSATIQKYGGATMKSMDNNNTNNNISLSKDNDYTPFDTQKELIQSSNSSSLEEKTNLSAYRRDVAIDEVEEKSTFQEIQDYWNEKEIIVHSKLHPFVEKYTRKLFKEGITVDEIKKSIDNYADIYFHPRTLMKYKWDLVTFLRQENACRSYIYKDLDDYIQK